MYLIIILVILAVNEVNLKKSTGYTGLNMEIIIHAYHLLQNHCAI